ncbi:hypothetical protein MRY87_04890 [bacterium]|nr:hypothetical protein [bacterium]
MERKFAKVEIVTEQDGKAAEPITAILPAGEENEVFRAVLEKYGSQKIISIKIVEWETKSTTIENAALPDHVK